MELQEITQRMEMLLDKESCADLLIEALRITDPEDQKAACLEVLPLLIGTPTIGQVISDVTQSKEWDPLKKSGLKMGRDNVDTIAQFLLEWGYPELAANVCTWGATSSDRMYELAEARTNRKFFGQGNPKAPLPLADRSPCYQLRDQLGRQEISSIVEMNKLPDAEFVAEYLYQMTGYDMPRACGVTQCRRPIKFWFDLRRIAGRDLCPLHFPKEALEIASADYRDKASSTYFRRAAKLLPQRFFAPEPPSPVFQLSPDP